MKCIKILASGDIQRVEDAQAVAMVAAHLAVYVPRSEWKLAGRP